MTACLKQYLNTQLKVHTFIMKQYMCGTLHLFLYFTHCFLPIFLLSRIFFKHFDKNVSGSLQIYGIMRWFQGLPDLAPKQIQEPALFCFKHYNVSLKTINRQSWKENYEQFYIFLGNYLESFYQTSYTYKENLH